ncbi:MAG: ATP-dependent zinc protease [Congregibacter sp.]
MVNPRKIHDLSIYGSATIKDLTHITENSSLRLGRRAFAAPLVALMQVLFLTGCAPFAEQQNATLASVEQSLSELEARAVNADKKAAAQAASLEEIQRGIRALSGLLEKQQSLLASLEAQNPPRMPASEDVLEGDEQASKLIVGRYERIWVEDLQRALPARIDTGAETASLDARDITIFERDGKPWVRFEIPDPGSETPLVLERRRVREALVVQSNSSEPERRPVIELGIQIGPVRQLAEFTLSDRSHLDFQMLVGRNILQDVMLVDVSATNIVPPPDVDTTAGLSKDD